MTERTQANLAALRSLTCSTSLSLEEALGLRWPSVNLTDRYVVRSGQLIPAFSVLVTSRWTYRGREGVMARRAVPLPPEALEALLRRYRRGATGPVFTYRERGSRPLDYYHTKGLLYAE